MVIIILFDARNRPLVLPSCCSCVPHYSLSVLGWLVGWFVLPLGTRDFRSTLTFCIPVLHTAFSKETGFHLQGPGVITQDLEDRWAHGYLVITCFSPFQWTELGKQTYSHTDTCPHTEQYARMCLYTHLQTYTDLLIINLQFKCNTAFSHFASIHIHCSSPVATALVPQNTNTLTHLLHPSVNNVIFD